MHYPLSIFYTRRACLFFGRSSRVCGFPFPVFGASSRGCGFGGLGFCLFGVARCFNALGCSARKRCSGVRGARTLGISVFRMLRFAVRCFSGSEFSGFDSVEGVFLRRQIFLFRGRAVFDSFGNHLGLLFFGRVGTFEDSFAIICGIFRVLFGLFLGRAFLGIYFYDFTMKKSCLNIWYINIFVVYLYIERKGISPERSLKIGYKKAPNESGRVERFDLY